MKKTDFSKFQNPCNHLKNRSKKNKLYLQKFTKIKKYPGKVFRAYFIPGRSQHKKGVWNPFGSHVPNLGHNFFIFLEFL